MKRLLTTALAILVVAAALAAPNGLGRRALTAGLVASAEAALDLQHGEPVDAALVARIRDEGLWRSVVMDTLGMLADVYGPRLTGSPNLQHAATWARDQLARWGLERATLEPAGSTGRGWEVERFSIETSEPQ